MSSGLDLRKRAGKRKDPSTVGSRRQGRLGDPLNAIDAGSPGEIRISSDVMVALQHLYNTSPSIQAARAILMGQLLSSGVVVRREGRDVNLKSTFSRHLEDVWVPFARNVVDHFLMFGFVCVSLEREAPPPFANFIKGKQMAATSQMGPREDGRHASQREPPTDSEARARKRPIQSDARLDRKITDRKTESTGNLVPMVPDIGQYELSFIHTGEVRAGARVARGQNFGFVTHKRDSHASRGAAQTNYVRQYRIFATNSDNVYRQALAFCVGPRDPS